MIISITSQTWRLSVRPILAGLAFGVVLIWVQNAFAATEQPIDNMGKEVGICARAIHFQERKNAIPEGLLKAMSFVESGRWYTPSGSDRGEILAWPWTVTTGGKGHYFPSRAKAVRFVKSLQAGGVKNIDVGCMQINLKYHPDAFASIERAFDPNANAKYAANFLRERFATSKSWLQAAGDYHSTTPALNKKYQQKVIKLWPTATASDGPEAKIKIQAQPFQPIQVYPAALPYQARMYARFPALDIARTKRFNKAFLKHRASGSNTIVNRMNATHYGVLSSQSSEPTREASFAAKRRAQLLAWRQSLTH